MGRDRFSYLPNRLALDTRIGLDISWRISLTRLVAIEESSDIESATLNIMRLFAFSNLSRDSLTMSKSCSWGDELECSNLVILSRNIWIYEDIDALSFLTLDNSADKLLIDFLRSINKDSSLVNINILNTWIVRIYFVVDIR